MELFPKHARFEHRARQESYHHRRQPKPAHLAPPNPRRSRRRSHNSSRDHCRAKKLSAGIEEVCVVVSPGDQTAYRAAAGAHASRLQFVEQPAPLGYGHAVLCAASFSGEDPFLLLVGDHLYVTQSEQTCARQLVGCTARSESCAVSAVPAVLMKASCLFTAPSEVGSFPGASAFTKSSACWKNPRLPSPRSN